MTTTAQTPPENEGRRISKVIVNEIGGRVRAMRPSNPNPEPAPNHLWETLTNINMSNIPKGSFMIGLTVIQILVYFFHNFLYGFDEFKGSRVPIGSILIMDSSTNYQIWRHFTQALVHTRLSTLLSNVAVQLTLGLYLEILNGFPTIFLIFTSGVVGGSLHLRYLTGLGHYRDYGAQRGTFAITLAYFIQIIYNVHFHYSNQHPIIPEEIEVINQDMDFVLAVNLLNIFIDVFSPIIIGNPDITYSIESLNTLVVIVIGISIGIWTLRAIPNRVGTIQEYIALRTNYVLADFRWNMLLFLVIKLVVVFIMYFIK